MREGGAKVSAIERRIAIWHTLCVRREVKIKTLAKEHDVSWITIYRDIEYLSLSHPIITIRGKYGGVKLPDWYIPSANHLSPEQLAFLDRLYLSLNSEDARMMKNIILTLSSR